MREHCGPGITYVENTEFATTNSLYSLWLARALLSDGCVVLNCDVLFHPQLLADLLTARHDAALLLAYRAARGPAVRRRGDEGQGAGRPRRRHEQGDGPGGGRRRERRNAPVRRWRRAGARREAGRHRRRPAGRATGRRGRSPLLPPSGRSTRLGRGVTRGPRSISRRTTSAPCATSSRRSRTVPARAAAERPRLRAVAGAGGR